MSSSALELLWRSNRRIMVESAGCLEKINSEGNYFTLFFLLLPPSWKPDFYFYVSFLLFCPPVTISSSRVWLVPTLRLSRSLPSHSEHGDWVDTAPENAKRWHNFCPVVGHNEPKKKMFFKYSLLCCHCNQCRFSPFHKLFENISFMLLLKAQCFMFLKDQSAWNGIKKNKTCLFLAK